MGNYINKMMAMQLEKMEGNIEICKKKISYFDRLANKNLKSFIKCKIQFKKLEKELENLKRFEQVKILEKYIEKLDSKTSNTLEMAIFETTKVQTKVNELTNNCLITAKYVEKKRKLKCLKNTLNSIEDGYKNAKSEKKFWENTVKKFKNSKNGKEVIL